MQAKSEQPDVSQQQKDEIRKKYKSVSGQPNQVVANALKLAAEVEYQKSGSLWCAFYSVDRAQAQFTGLAMTNNTQKILDSDVLTQEKPKMS